MSTVSISAFASFTVFQGIVVGFVIAKTYNKEDYTHATNEK